MNHAVGGVLVLVLGLSAVAAEDQGQERPATPAEQYKALLKEYQVASHVSSFGKTDEERKKAVAIVDGLPRRFLELAETYPKDPIAMHALSEVVWVEGNVLHPAGGRDSPGARAVALLLRDHVGSDKLGPVCQRLSSGFRKECETFLRAVLETNPHREVRALACVALADFLNSRSRRFDLIKGRPELAERYEALVGKNDLEELQRQDSAKVAQEAEALFEQAAEKYGDVKIPFGGTVGERARSQLYEARHLSVGKEAPDVEGEDQDGKRFKLSDYRGKVVLLYFWQQQ